MSSTSAYVTSSIGNTTENFRPAVPELFRQAAAMNQSALAIQFGATELTYGELDERSTRLSGYLRFIGVGEGARVGICLTRSPEFVVAALAVLKAGGAYVPLDPSYPPERLAFIIGDCKPQALVTRGCTVRSLFGQSANVIDIDRVTNVAQSYYALSTPSPDSLAYLIYTSGSTGTPKGVEITHSNLSNLVAWHIAAFNVTASDRTTQVASIGFDAAVWEIWPSLCTGASLFIPEEETRNSASLLRDWLIENAITVTFVPTPLAEQMLGLDWPDSTPLRVLLTGGDTLHHYPRRGLPFVLVNNYGPTECTVVATSGIISPQDGATSPPDIGRAIYNTRVVVLDENLIPVPTGRAGELCIAGAGVGRGYFNRPELTAANFVTDEVTSERLYRTGDLVRRLPDGRIEFLGRIDEQLKVRGFRIEPNEVVAALNSHSSVRDSVVTASGNGSAEKRLLAYVIAKDGATLSDAELRHHLKAKLPEYMVPSLFIGLDELPLNPNQKVDRSALPAPNEANVIRDEAYCTPQNVIEQQLSALVSELLQIQSVGLNDNFFLLGGHSLLGAQLIARIRDTFKVELSLSTLFTAPTVALLSVEVERSSRRYGPQ